MIVTMKKDWSPRRIIDYKRLNDAIPCQTNINKSPFMCASACPPKKKKTLFDAKDGYHSVVLAVGESREVTEFMCDHKPLLAYFRMVDPKPLDNIVNKRLRKYVSEIGELRFSIFHIPGADNFCQTGAVGFPQERLVMTGEMI